MKKIIILFVSLGLIVLFAACSISVTTANYTDLKVASEVDTSNKPVVITSKFGVESPVIYVTGILKNAPEGTVIKAEWYYLESDPVTFIDEASLESVDTTTPFYFNLSKPNNGWPVGNYEVKLYIDDEYKNSSTFSVE